MATAKKFTEADKALAASDETLSFSLVNFRYPDPILSTQGLNLGERCVNGPYTGAIVKGLYGIPLGCIIELEHGGRTVTLLNTGEYSGVLA